jgi:hypothetical protein
MLKVSTKCSILGNFFHPNHMPAAAMRHKSINYYDDPETPTVGIPDQFLQFRGGSVDLIKNEDTAIATLCLNRPEKRNAFSGNYNSNINSSSNYTGQQISKYFLYL